MGGRSRRDGDTIELEDAVAVVTGGASGIGAALARTLTDAGARVLVVDVDGPGAQQVGAELDAPVLEADVGEPAAGGRIVEEARGRLGPVDLLCLNAGVGLGRGVVDTSLADWERSWEVNVMGHVHPLRAWLPGALERGRGHVLHTASAAGLLTMLEGLPYSVTKHGVVALAEWLAITHGDDGIGVSCLCPQFVRTPMLGDLEGSLPEGAELPGEVLTPGEVARAAVAGVEEDRFLILPHPEVADHFRHRAADPARWIEGMRRLQRSWSDAGRG